MPGIYDDVLQPTEAEIKAWKTLPFDEESYRAAQVGSPALTGEPGFSVLERLWSRPTLEVHGMPGGFIGAGAKTVIPARAVAKLSRRLVPDMPPADTFAKLKSFVEAIVPRGCTVEVFGRETVFVRGGGSIPIIGDFIKVLGLPAVVMGFGLPDDNLHAPNEKFNLSNFHRGIESIVRWMELLGL